MKIKQYILQINLIGILIFGMSCVSYSQESEEKEYKNEVGAMLTLDRSPRYLFYQPQFGLNYSRLLYKRNLFVFGNVLIRQYNKDNNRRRNRLYEVGIEYRWFPFKKLPLTIGAQAGFMNSNWLYDARNSGKYDYKDYTRNYLVNFTPMITYGNRFKVALGADIGYGKSVMHSESSYSGTLETLNYYYWTGVISKQGHLKLSFSF
jgi:hypothetical protein